MNANQWSLQLLHNDPCKVMSSLRKQYHASKRKGCQKLLSLSFSYTETPPCLSAEWWRYWGCPRDLKVFDASGRVVPPHNPAQLSRKRGYLAYWRRHCLPSAWLQCHPAVTAGVDTFSPTLFADATGMLGLLWCWYTQSAWKVFRFSIAKELIHSKELSNLLSKAAAPS